MGRFVALFLALLMMLLTLARPVNAAPPASSETEHKLIVGTHAVPPFVIKGDDGSWSGISIDLWRRVAARAGLSYEIREYPVEELLAPNPEIDVVVSLNVSPLAESRLDLTHAFYSTGLAIAVAPSSPGILSALSGVFSGAFVRIIGVTVVVLAFFGLLMWLAERRKNESQFGGGFMRGLGNGFWWSAVTMTTVGYGDKSPVTLPGRLVALFWMYAGVFAIAIFTAQVSSALTVNELSSNVHGPADLPKVRVGTVAPSGGARYLDRRGVPYRRYETAPAALRALEKGEIDAVVYEAPILAYFIKSDFEGLRVLPGTFDNHGYAFGLRTGSALRERVNLALLDVLSTESWSKLLLLYVGMA